MLFGKQVHYRLCSVVFMLIFITVLKSGCATDPAKLPMDLPLPPEIPQIQTSNYSEPKNIYVDSLISAVSCKNYSPDSRSCGPGADAAFDSLSAATLAALPGDTVILRGGTYTEQLVVDKSGAPGAPITFKAQSGEIAKVTGGDKPAIHLHNSSYIIIDGLTITKVLGWGRIEDSHYNIFRNNRFSETIARGTTGGLKFVRGHYNRVENNSFERGNDSIVLQESDRNLIEGNRFRWGRHSLISVRCGNFNVIRHNVFHNERQKAMEIYDCEAVSDAPYRLNATKRNLVEYNRFIYTRGPSAPHKYNAIQLAGQHGIVRRNLFYDNQGGGINLQVYSDEALNNFGHRIYHNTFYLNKCYALIGSGSLGEIFGDNLVVNNIFYKNESCRQEPVQIAIGDPRAVRLLFNAILNPLDSPGFISEAGRDLQLRQSSTLIDSGAFLTKTIGSGSGTSMKVEDVRFFFDGYGISGLKGDIIQLAGDKDRARIRAVEYGTSTLVLETVLKWKDGQGVALAYEGEAPDPGAIEHK